MANKQSRKVIQHFNNMNIYRNIDNNGSRLSNIGQPIAPYDAATKQYVDDNIDNTGFSFGSGLVFNSDIISVSPIQTQITQIGNIAVGTWSANTISVSYGGTGKTSFQPNKLVSGNGASPINSISDLEYDNGMFNIYSKTNIYNTSDSFGIGSGGSLTVYGGCSVSKNMYIGTTIFGNLSSSYATVSNLSSQSITVGNLKTVLSDISSLSCGNINISSGITSNFIYGNIATLGSIVGSSVSIVGNIFSNTFSSGNTRAVISSIGTLKSSDITTTNINISNGNITSLSCSSFIVSNSSMSNLSTSFLYSSSISSGSINASNLSSTGLYITNGNFQYISSSNLSVLNSTLDYISNSNMISNFITSSNIFSNILNSSYANLYIATVGNLKSNSNISLYSTLSNLISDNINCIYISTSNLNSQSTVNVSSSSINISSSNLSSLRVSCANINCANGVLSNLTSGSIVCPYIYSDIINTVTLNNSTGNFNLINSDIITCGSLYSSSLNSISASIHDVDIFNITCSNLISSYTSILGSVNCVNISCGDLYTSIISTNDLKSDFATFGSLYNSNITSNNIIANTNCYVKQKIVSGYDYSGTPSETSGNIFSILPSIFTDNTSLTNASNTFFSPFVISPTTISALSSGVTTNKVSTLSLQGTPIQGSNQTFNYAGALSLGYVYNNTGGYLSGQIMFERNDGNWFGSMYTEHTTNRIVLANASLSGGGGIGMYTYTDTPIVFSHIESSTNVSPIDFVSFSNSISVFKSTQNSTNISNGAILVNGGMSIQKTLNVSNIITDTIAKSSGTFDIIHPLNENKRLVHSFVESPRCDLIYRGKTCLENGIASVNLDMECVNDLDCSMSPGTFESLVRNPQFYLQNKSSFDPLIASISGAYLNIECSNTTSNSVVYWMVVGERNDGFIKDWSRTNKNGYLKTEYDI